MSENPKRSALLPLFWIGQAADVGTTMYAVDHFGPDVESTLLYRLVFAVDDHVPDSLFGVGEYVLFPVTKLVMSLLALRYIPSLTKDLFGEKAEKAAVPVLTAATYYVVYSNLRYILSMGA